MIERGGAVVMGMLATVQQVTIQPLIQATMAPGTLVYTDEYDIYGRLEEWGYDHESVCHSAGLAFPNFNLSEKGCGIPLDIP